MRKFAIALFAIIGLLPTAALADTCFLKQSTALATGIRLGPFVDQTDGFTAETALTLSQADIRLSKNEGAFAQKNDATSCTHLENGYYKCPIDATDTGTAGLLLIAVNESGALPVWKECMVLPGATFDALVTNAAGAANGFLIAGTNAPITFSGSGAAMTLTSTGGNGAGLAITGNGSGAGVTVAAGATGKGVSVTTTSGDGVSVTPTAGHALVLTANGTSKHGMTVTGGTAGTSHGALFTAGTGGKDLQAATGITVDACTGCSSVQGPTIMPEVAYVKGSTLIIVELFIKDSSTGLGKTGLTNGSPGLTVGWGRADQGNAANTTCPVQPATRGAYTSCGFVEKDATNAAGVYEVGLPAAVLATGADQAIFTIYGVAGTTPTILPVALVDVGLQVISTTLGTPTTGDLASDVAAVKSDTASIKGKTDSMSFAGSDINAKMNSAAASLTYNLTGDITGNLSGSVGSVTGAVGSVTGAVGSVTGAVGSVTGNVGGNVTGSVGSVAAGGIVASSFGAGAIDASAIAADAIGSSEIAATGADKIGDDVQTRFPANFAAQAITAGGVVTAGGTFLKNTASQVFPIYLVDATGAPVTGLGAAVTVTVSKDGGAFGAITGSVAETGSGWYDVNLSQADTNCTNCKYVATGAGATARPFYFRTAP